MGKQTVYDRDNKECFYCGKSLTFEEATHEHLLATSKGGDNSDANTTVACKDCNLAAGSLPIVEKVKLRDAKRGIENKKITTLTIGDIKVEVKEQ